MNILLCPMGSSGDVHPFVGLGVALAARGHRVRMIVNEYFEELVRRVGLEYIEFTTAKDFIELADHPALWHPRRAFFYIAQHGILKWMRQQYEIIREHHVPGETVVVASCLGFGARIAQEHLGIPLISAHLQPFVLWSSYATPHHSTIPFLRFLPRPLKDAFFWTGEKFIIDPFVCPETNAFRRELGLPPMKRAFGRWIHSPLATLCLFPEWYAARQPDWPRNTHTTGFPLWDERHVTTMPPQLNDFLNHQDPPIVFTPGSAVLHGQDFFRAAVEATQRLGRSAILLTRFPEQIPRSLPETVRHYDYIPFSQVLPRAAALVHHGGIGSTAQAMAAGIPQLMMPMAHDQPDNARRVKKMHTGDWLLPRHFSGRRVAEKLSRLLNAPHIGQHCRKIQERFQDADPISQACDVIEEAIR